MKDRQTEKGEKRGKENIQESGQMIRALDQIRGQNIYDNSKYILCRL